jgi:CRP-like cAMP-binding protein
MQPTGNRMLDALDETDRQTILKSSTQLSLPIRTPLFHAESRPLQLYFLTGGAASLVINTREGSSVEVGMVGSDGLVGAESLLGPALTEAECFMQISGEGYAISRTVLKELSDRSEGFRSLVLDFVQSQLSISRQLACCNRVHEAESRLARWLLMASDIAKTSELHLTQEFLSEMLGTRRTTVVLVAGGLQKAEIIAYKRGKVKILKRDLLVEHACSCYAAVKRLGVPTDRTEHSHVRTNSYQIHAEHSDGFRNTR